MTRYFVTLPIVGRATVEVEAENEQAAIEAALEGDGLTLQSIDEWEALSRGCRGNVCSLPLHSASVVEADD